jgi:hypothetical protein
MPLAWFVSAAWTAWIVTIILSFVLSPFGGGRGRNSAVAPIPSDADPTAQPRSLMLTSGTEKPAHGEPR